MSPNPTDKGTWIQQDAWFHLGDFDQETATEYQVKKEGNGVYVFVINGTFTIDDLILNKRDAMGVWEVDKISFLAQANSKVLLIEVPMFV